MGKSGKGLQDKEGRISRAEIKKTCSIMHIAGSGNVRWEVEKMKPRHIEAKLCKTPQDV